MIESVFSYVHLNLHKKSKQKYSTNICDNDIFHNETGTCLVTATEISEKRHFSKTEVLNILNIIMKNLK